MNSNTTSQFMDKQIMDLSNSHSSAMADNNSSDFIDFMNRQPSEKKDDIVPSYDFMPIRPAAGSSSPPPPATRSSMLDVAGDNDPPLRSWNSFDSKTNASSTRNYNSLDAEEPAKFTLGKNQKPVSASLDSSLISEIDKTMKKYTDNMMHAIESMSARLSQLETRSRNLEHIVDDLKLSFGNTHDAADGKMRQLENILREVQSGVKDIKDKQDIVEAQLQISKLRLPKVDQAESHNIAHPDPTQPGPPAHQQFSTVSLTQPPHTFPPPNAPPPPVPQQNFQPQVQPPNQFPQNQVPPIPQREPYFPGPGQTPENLSQQYQVPPLQPQPQQHPQPHPQPQPQPQPQHPPPPMNQYQPPPQTQYSQPAPLPPSQPLQSFSAVNSSPPQPPLSNHSEETPYPPSQIYPPGIRQSPAHLSTGPPPAQQFYGTPPNVYEPPSSRPGPGYSGSFGASSGHGEPYPYAQYNSGSPVKQQYPSPAAGQSGGSGYPNLPTARILPQALPTASGVSGGSGSGSSGNGNKVPIDDVVDKVTNMGFPRDQVRATVRRLTENGQAVDLNIVLDKLMNDGDVQPPRGWFGR